MKVPGPLEGSSGAIGGFIILEFVMVHKEVLATPEEVLVAL